MKIKTHRQPGGEHVATVRMKGRVLRVCGVSTPAPIRSVERRDGTTEQDVTAIMRDWCNWERGGRPDYFHGPTPRRMLREIPGERKKGRAK
jgi:hypothetical protein